MNMLFVYQALFVGTTAWDFFLTVVVGGSIRSQIFSILPATTSFLIIVPWLIGIFLLALMLLIYLNNKDYSPPTYKVNFEYIGMMIIYVVLFLLSIFTPSIPWILVFNYLVNIVWIWSLIRFRRFIQIGLEFK